MALKKGPVRFYGSTMGALFDLGPYGTGRGMKDSALFACLREAFILKSARRPSRGVPG